MKKHKKSFFIVLVVVIFFYSTNITTILAFNNLENFEETENVSVKNQATWDPVTDVVYIPDPNFRNVIKKEVLGVKEDKHITRTGIKDIPGMEDITVLDFDFMGFVKDFDISNFSGIEYFSNIELLSFYGQKNITDESILPVKKLKKLEEIRFYKNNKITNIDILTGMDTLRKVTISDCGKIANLNPIIDFQLESLELNNVPQLKYQLNDIWTITTLKNLELNKMDLTSIEGIQSLLNLEDLVIEYNPRLTDISPLTNFSFQNHISLMGLGIKNVDALINSNLKSVTLWENPNLENLDGLINTTNMRTLQCGSDRDAGVLKDISGIRNNRLLGQISLQNNQILDITPLSTTRGLCRSAIVDAPGTGVGPSVATLDNQKATIDTIETELGTDLTINLDDIIKANMVESRDINNISNGGVYDADKHTITWKNLNDKTLSELKFNFDYRVIPHCPNQHYPGDIHSVGHSSDRIKFNGQVTVPISYLYNLQVNTDGNGAAVVDKQVANEGDIINVTANPNEGYEQDIITVNGANITGNSFPMLAENVTVDVTFKLIDYNVNLSEVENGTITSSKQKANINDVITLNISANSGYKLKDGSLKVITSGGVEIPLTNVTRMTNGSYTFTMPADSVTVLAEFELIPVVDPPSVIPPIAPPVVEPENPTPPTTEVNTESKPETGKNPTTGTSGVAGLLVAIGLAGTITLFTTKKKNK